MLTTKIVLLSAHARYGKDTVAGMLKQGLEARGNSVMIFHFADTLKLIAEKCYGWIPGDKGPVGRTILQNIGAEFRSNHEDCWVNIAKEIARGTSADYFLIPDCRYKNELINFFEFPTVSFRIERPNFDNGLTPEQKAHKSEIDLDNYPYFDYTIINDGTLEDLNEKVGKILQEI